jgi:predicted transcriptional regulator
LERRKEIIEKYLSESNPSNGNEEQKRITNPNQLSPELIGEYLKELLKNPEIKKEYDKRSKEDPNFIKDPQKGTQFYMDMIQKIREQSKEEK